MNIPNSNIKIQTPNAFSTFERNKNTINLNYPKDSVSLYNMSENMRYKTTYYGGAREFEGTINGQNCELKHIINSENRKGIDEQMIGNIGGKELHMDYQKREKYKGIYNGKDFDINVSLDKKRNYMTKMSGQINGKPLELDFSQKPSVPKDSDTRDIVSTILFSHQNFPFVANGKIEKIVHSRIAEECIENNLKTKEIKKENFIQTAINTVTEIISALIQEYKQ